MLDGRSWLTRAAMYSISNQAIKKLRRLKRY